MSKPLLGPGGRPFLMGGRYLGVVAGAAPNLSLTLAQSYLGTAGATFHISTTASSDDTATDAPIIVSYTGGPPALLEARVVGSNGSPVTGFDWTDITASTQFDPATKTGLGYLLNLPVGTGYKRQVRAGAFSDADSKIFNVGPAIATMGQSNQNGQLDDDAGNPGVNVPGTSAGEYDYILTYKRASYFGIDGFVLSNLNPIGNFNPLWGGGGMMLRLIGNRLKAKYGRDVGVMNIPLALNGTAIAAWLPGGGAYKIMTNSGAAYQQVGFMSPKNVVRGDYRLVTLHQGESNNSAAYTRALRFEDNKAFCLTHINQVAKYGRPANKITILFAMMGVYGIDSSSGNPWAANIEAIRGAALDIVAYGKTQGWDVRIGWNCLDLDPELLGGGGLHFQGIYKQMGNRRQTQAIQNVLDPVGCPVSAAGPYLTGEYSRTGDDITLTVADESNTGLEVKNPGAPITGLYGNTSLDFTGTDVLLGNTVILPGTMQIRTTATMAGGGAVPATFYIRHCGGKMFTRQSYHPDVSNLVYNKFWYPTGADPTTEQFKGFPLQYGFPLQSADYLKVGP